MHLRRLLLTLSMLLAAACAVPHLAATELQAPVVEGTGAALAEPDRPRGPELFAAAHPVLQAIPTGDDVRWGGGGRAFTLTGRGCETSIVDAVAGRVTARIAACRVWPSPTRDVFLTLMDDRVLVAWDGAGARLGMFSSELPPGRSPAWSPDGTRVALLQGNLVHIAPASSPHEGHELLVPTASGMIGGTSEELSWRADGAVVAVHDRKEVWTVGGGEGSVSEIAAKAVPTGCVTVQQAKFAPRGDVLAVRCDEDFAELWDTRTGRLAMTTHRVRDWSATGRLLTVLAPAVEVHDAATDLTLLRPPTESYDRLQFSPDDAWLANDSTAGPAPSVDVWDVSAGKRVLHLPGMSDPRWSAEGAYLSARTADPKAPSLVVLASGSWNEVWRRPGAQGTWSTKGARLAVTSAMGGLELLDATTASTRPLPSATTAWFARLYEAPDGALMAPMIPRADGRGQAIRVEPGGNAKVVDVAADAVHPWLSPDGTRMLRSVSDSRMALMMGAWRLYVDDLTTKDHFFIDQVYGGFDARWSARGHRLLVVHGAALFFDTDTRRVWRVPAKQPSVAALDAEGARAALETADGLQVVKLASKEPPIEVSPRSDPRPSFLALAGNRLAAVTHDGEVSIWNVEDRALVASWSAGFAPEHVSWVGEGERLALSRRDVLRLAKPDGSDAVNVTALRTASWASLRSERVAP